MKIYYLFIVFVFIFQFIAQNYCVEGKLFFTYNWLKFNNLIKLNYNKQNKRLIKYDFNKFFDYYNDLTHFFIALD